MKLVKTLLIALSLIYLPVLHSQSARAFLTGNNIRALVNERGVLFLDLNTYSARYEYPSGSNNHLIYAAGLWFGGHNQNQELKLAAQKYAQAYDYYQGPYSTTGEYDNPDYAQTYEHGLWLVRKSDILYHIDNYDQPNYVAPNSILHWPGNGDPSVGVAEQLAPYVDVNNNGIYEPHLGDYPCIKGEQAAYQIMHDDSLHGESGGDKIGVEIHIMVYQSYAPDFIGLTTFVDVTVINKGQNSFEDFKGAFFTDTDIGHSEDDYIGSAPSRNLMYSYNSSNFDGGMVIGAGYSDNPPTVGVMSLNKEIEYSGSFYRADIADNPMMADPVNPSDYWNYMNGKWLDGSEWTMAGNGYGGTDGPTKHLYDGNPFLGTGWTELDTDGNQTTNTPGDRRLIMTTKGEQFKPGDTLMYHYAVLVNRDGNHLENVDGLLNYADSAQLYFNNTTYPCFNNGSVGLSELEKGEFNLYPNPATSQVKIVWEDLKVEEITISSYQGRVVRSVPINKTKGEVTIDIHGLSSGVYFVSIGNTIRKLVVQ